MANIDNVRATALMLQNCVNQLYNYIAPIYAITSTWTLNSIDDLLPAEGSVKDQVEFYKAINVPSLSLSAALQDVLSSPGPGVPGGTYNLPVTTAPISFTIMGPIPVGILGIYAVGANIVIDRVCIYTGELGEGDSFIFDILCNDQSIFGVTPPEINHNPCLYDIMIVNGINLSINEVESTDLLKFECIQKPEIAEDFGVTIWHHAG